MVDPYDLTKPWDKVRLQEWFIFGVCVPGKNAGQTAKKVELLLDDMRVQYDDHMIGYPLMFTHFAPFESIETAIKRGKLGWYLRKHRLGQYKRINKALRGMIKVDPATVTLEELEAIHGVGAKTARMLLLYTRPDQEMIPLDTHILKWLRAHGYAAPKTTPPPGRKYRELEAAFIAEGKKRGLSAKEWDTKVWQQYAKG
jgi:thermostable 8-oxoguanine DNA glycosylase